MKKRVADILIETLIENGIKDCFLVTGGGAMHLDNALALHDGIRKICNHHEQACAMAADAYARLSGRPAAVCVTSGPGTTNTLTGVMGAWQDSIPMIIISGQVRLATSSMICDLPLRYRGVQEFNIIPVVSSFTKYAVMLTDPLEVKRVACQAVHQAMSGRRGPVWIDVPLDIQSALVEEADVYESEAFDLEEPDFSSELSKLDSCIETLRAAKRPCILGGTGVVSANVQDEFEAFVNRINIPAVGGGWCPDMLYTEHPLYYGLSGDLGPRTGNFILQNADVILVLGNSLSFRQTGFAQEKFATQAKIIWVDADEAESKKPGMRFELFIHMPLREFFGYMQDKSIQGCENPEWIEYCNCLKERFSPFKEVTDFDEGARVNSYRFWKLFDAFETGDTLIAMGNSRANAAKLQVGVKKKGARALTNYLCGSMGFDLPAAVGAAVASGKDVLCMTGDGSFMMNLQELQTIIHYRLPVKVVVFANDGYEAIRQTCSNFFNGVYIGCNKESGVSFPDFSKLADTFGCRYKCCEVNGDIESSLEWLFTESGNLFLEVRQEIGNTAVPKLMSRMREDGTFETPPLQDMAPFLDRDEYRKWMISEQEQL